LVRSQHTLNEYETGAPSGLGYESERPSGVHFASMDKENMQVNKSDAFLLRDVSTGSHGIMAQGQSGYRTTKNEQKGNFSRNQFTTNDTSHQGRNTRTTGFTSAVGGANTMLGADASSYNHNMTNIQQTPGGEMILNYPHSFENQDNKSDLLF
jgi:hypothetical protein